MNSNHIPGTPGVYRITNTATNQSYIGSSRLSCRRRIQSHFYKLRSDTHESEPLQESFDTHGEENFVVEMIEECPATAVRERERFWIFTTQPEFNEALKSPVISQGDFPDVEGYAQCVSFWKGVGIHAMEEANGYARRAKKRFNVQIPLPFPTFEDESK